MKVGDVVRVHCPDHNCTCCNMMPPARIIGSSRTLPNERNRWALKPLFGNVIPDWPERGLTILEASDESNDH